MSNLNVQLWTRGANSTIQRVLDLDSIMFQSRSGGTIKFDFSLLMKGHCADQIQLSQRKIALGSEGLIARSRSQFLFLLRDIECALRAASTLAPVCSSAYCALRTSMRTCFFSCSLRSSAWRYSSSERY